MPEFPIIHLPAGKRNPNFTGRQQSLEQLHLQLHQSEAIDVVSQAITGLGGIGKTQLVREYIYRHQATYDLIWWIKADNIISIKDDLAALAVAVGVIEPSNSDRQASLNAAHRWLGQTDKRWLLIFDNVDELPLQTLQPYLPTHGRGQLIFTSRNTNWGGLVGPKAILHLDSFSRAESIAFLRRRLGDTAVDQAQLDPIAELLGDFPLALEHAAAYIEASQISYASYRQQYQQYRQALWRDAQPPQGYHGTISTTWEMAFQKLPPNAVTLLRLGSFLAADDIPLSLFDHPTFSEGEENPLQESYQRDQAIADLRRYSLVERADEQIRFHRLVQTVTRDQLPTEQASQWLSQVMELLSQSYRFDEYDMDSWQSSATLIPHLQTACQLAQTYGLENNRVAYLHNQAGFYLNHFGYLAAAQPHYERALVIHEKVLGPDHPDTASSLNNLGSLLSAMGDHAAAKPYYERALAIREKVLGPDHPNTASSLNNVGFLLKAMGEYAAAKPHYERALAIWEKGLGPDHPNTATSLNNLGALLHDMGDHAAAKPYYERALTIRKKALGPDHPHTASSLNNVAWLYYEQGEKERAITLMRRAVAIYMHKLGPEHPDTKLAQQSLAEMEAGAAGG